MLAGCADLSAVRKFASAGTAIADNNPVIAGWPHAYDRVSGLARTPVIRSHDPDGLRKFGDRNSRASAEARLAVEAAKMLALYLNALGQLAGGTLADVGSQASSIQASVTALGAPKPEVSIASQAIAEILAGWQRAAVSDVIAKADPPVQVISAYLAAVSDAVRLAEKDAAASTAEYWTQIGVKSGDGVEQVFAARAMGEDDNYYLDLEMRASAARTAFLKIGEDHAALVRSKGNLSKASATLEEDLPILEKALASLANR